MQLNRQKDMISDVVILLLALQVRQSLTEGEAGGVGGVHGCLGWMWSES